MASWLVVTLHRLHIWRLLVNCGREVISFNHNSFNHNSFNHNRGTHRGEVHDMHLDNTCDRSTL